MVVNWQEKECGHDAKEGADKDSVYFSVPLKSVGLNLLLIPNVQFQHSFIQLQWRIQDSPQEGVPTLREGGGSNIRFCQIFPKTAWKWEHFGP